ncbi:cytochrome c [Salipiger sp. PrR002]|uniref:c-type cytochrome n=1 Tax=Salipiger sp. PrR002 TaxID=2706489 RepID=UPI0013B63B59|nr:cytochrome c [Salipiger sp. PrR002]NDV98037.1 c-type cytochrome [Salipiger sp. PrR002]NDW57012.1 c-type cytochrome [Salipiger sp. PrR004]
MRRLLGFSALAALVAAGALWLISAPDVLPEGEFAGDAAGDPARGESIFTAAGCASCHHAPESEDKLVLAGGQRFASDFGTFIAPNISPDPVQGIGAWSLHDFANALLRGVSPEGQHYYPAFPYGAYIRMQPQDVANLWSYIQSLPASQEPSQPHEVGFPFNIRRGLGLWKQLYLDPSWVMADAGTEELARGRYLVEALAHCGECHTPRDGFGGLQREAWLTGAPNPSGEGSIPALTPDELSWDAASIAYYLETGFTPDYDSAGGHMVAVVENFAKLPAEDRAAVAAYVKALPEGGAME